MDSAQIFIYSLLSVFIATFYIYARRKHSYFKDHNILHVKPTFFVGNLIGIGTKHHLIDYLRDVYDKFRGQDVIAGFYLFLTKQILVIDVELAKNILVKDFAYFTDKGVVLNDDNEPLLSNLVWLGGEKWHSLRMKLSTAFSSGKIKAMFHTISDRGPALISALERASANGQSLNVKRVISKYTLDVTSSVAFGIEVNTLGEENLEFVKIGREVFESFEMGVKDIFMSLFPKQAEMLKLRFFNQNIEDFFFKVIGGNIEYREKEKIQRNDFLDLLIQLKNGNQLTMKECIAQGFMFYTAGSDTSSTAVSYCLMELGRDQEVQEKLRREINEKIEEFDGKLTYECLQEMSYLLKVVNETLRLHPPAPIVLRKAIKDYKIPNRDYTIPKGTQIFIPNYGFHYDKEFWPEPEKFDPERFSPEEIAKRPNFAFLPFGEGPRICLGQRFGLLTVKFAIASIIKNFKVTVDDSKVKWPLRIDPRRGGDIDPVGGYWVHFEKINDFN